MLIFSQRLSGSALPVNRDDECGSEHDESFEEELLIQMAECRFCQEDDDVANLESPCACNGSLKIWSPICRDARCSWAEAVSRARELRLWIICSSYRLSRFGVANVHGQLLVVVFSVIQKPLLFKNAIHHVF